MKVKQVKTFFSSSLWEKDLSDKSRFSRWVLGVCRVFFVMIRGYKRDSCGLQASALTYITLVSLVPMLAIMFSFSRGLGLQQRIYDAIGLEKIEVVDPVTESTSYTFRIAGAPVAGAEKAQPSEGQKAVDGSQAVEKAVESAETVAVPTAQAQVTGKAAETTEAVQDAAKAVASDSQEAKKPGATRNKSYLLEFPESLQNVIIQVFTYVENTNFAAMGIFGSILLIISVLLSITKLEKCFNSIWGVEGQRGFFKRFAEYLLVLILMPVLLMVASAVNSVLMNESVFEFTNRYLGFFSYVVVIIFRLFSVLVFCLAFAFLFKFMPNTRVNPACAIVSGVFTGIIWLIVMALYLKLQFGLANFNRIYGTFAALPFFLAILYANWCIVLLGCEMGFAMQYHHLLTIRKLEQTMPAGACMTLGQAIMYEACKAYYSPSRTWNSEVYAYKHSLAANQYKFAMSALINAGLLLPVDSVKDNGLFVPGIAPEVITPATVEEAFREYKSTDNKAYQELLPEALRSELMKYYDGYEANLKSRSFSELVKEA